MAELLLLTSVAQRSAEVLPALTLLPHHVRVLPTEPTVLLEIPDAHLVLLDARQDLAAARTTCRMLRATGVSGTLMAILTEGGLAALSPDWGANDFIVNTASPAEVEARIRLALQHGETEPQAGASPAELSVSELTLNPSGYTARLRGNPLDLTYKEFELLKYLMMHSGRAFTRAQLLQEVWGYDYYGGTRTVDVHVRRLRAKLGTEYDQLIGTVRNVGYRFNRFDRPNESGRPGLDTTEVLR